MMADRASAPQTGSAVRRRWQPWALAAICVVAAGLYAWDIGGSWGNAYYSAAVKSMSQSFENFFFGSLDAAGVVTVDKPPMALWLQVVSVKILGYSQFAVQLPQVLAGGAAVVVLHRTVRRWAGENAGLLAALVLALTPITVAINRINNPDTLLVLLVVGAAYAMTRACEGPRATGWLALAGLLVGCGFLTKMLQGWMVLPAFVAAYLVASRSSWGRKAADLAVAGAVLVVGSFWWVAATALWPEPKPYIGGSEDGSAWDLVFGYNGFGRIFGGGNMRGGGQMSAGPPAGSGSSDAVGGMPGGGGGPGGGFSGQAGILRMFGDQLAGQISWLLPLCGLVLAAVCVSGVLRLRAGRRLDRRGAAGWVLWGGWLLVVGLVFSFAQGIMHPYYTTMMAPAVGAIAGAGLVRFWQWYRRPARRAWLLLPLGVALTVFWAFVVVMRNPDWHAWVGYVALGLAAAAVALLLVQRGGRRRLARAGLALGLAAVLAVPSAWSVITAVGSQDSMNGANAMAGPSTGMFGGDRGGSPGGTDAAASVPGGVGGAQDSSGQDTPPQQGAGAPGGMGGAPGGSTAELSEEQQALLGYVESEAGDRTVPLAVEGGAMSASPYIINSDLTVVAMGGFGGTDDAPAVEQLTAWRESGELGFVLIGGGRGGIPPSGTQVSSGAQSPMGGEEQARGEREEWVKQNCTQVGPKAWGGSQDSSQQLYSCR
ncbi:4-amino-4-deoxy-L-arabinose transferase-like glycosyltransferase [Lipingzhangella halophila]|uniref:4-amino-4-deoxy-L-arabinose transferase-like glycosyltransferase n=1 Tax=Lipingzhangella halophila TaxID=1783352 RepID=A0A7W7RIY7_9ACTN|nr:glycosyltransferase family 39 protein [Lipingzhangella halophila]MBB4932852.1 4-amino-4-deoxy-L-arabinose transferase-like glycosyltransferase [Lipingzhangella halophila]